MGNLLPNLLLRLSAIKGCTAVCSIITVKADPEQENILSMDLLNGTKVLVLLVHEYKYWLRRMELLAEMAAALKMGKKLVLLACSKDIHNSIITRGFQSKVNRQLQSRKAELQELGIYPEGVFSFKAVINLSDVEFRQRMTGSEFQVI
jgi:hypothetical protein